MSAKSKQKLLAFTIFGALFGQAFEGALRPVSTTIIVSTVLVLVALLNLAKRKRAGADVIKADTLGFEISLGILTAAATVVAHRLVTPLPRSGKLVVFAIVMTTVVAVLIGVNLKERKARKAVGPHGRVETPT